MGDQIYSVDATQRAFETTWEKAEGYLRGKDTGKFLGALAFQEVDYVPLDASLRTILGLLEDRLNKPANYIPSSTSKETIFPPGKVLLQPRGSYASRSGLRGRADLDLDLVFPENFKIVFQDDKGKGTIQRTISQVLGSQDLFGVNPGDGHDGSGNLVVTKDGLRLVLLYVWGKLVSEKDYELPNKFTKKPLNIPQDETITVRKDLKPAMRIVPEKTLATLTRSISAQITDNPKYPNLDVDFFVKVVTKRFGGEEVLVGIDKDGPLGSRNYQITTFIPSGKEWLGGRPLSPINRSALLALKWWKNSFPDDKTIKPFKVRDPKAPKGTRDGLKKDIKIKSHHFLSALNALQELPPTDPLHVSEYGSLPFSLIRVMDVMVKVLTYLQRAYQPAERFNVVYHNDWDPSIPKTGELVVFPFPQDTCGVFETLYKQIAVDIVGYDSVINSKVIPDFIARLRETLNDWAKAHPTPYTPDTYAYEDL